MKITYYLASSLDGYIANGDGDISWLEDLGIPMEETNYEEFFSTIDALVMGRKTYEMILSFGAWPYGNKPVWICSSNKIKPMEGCNLQQGTTPEEVTKLANKMEVKHLWLVGGGSLASSFLQSNLLTHVSLALMPIILGGGIKMFGELPNSVLLKEESSKFYDSGFRQIEYSIKNT
jgi:dihydrofolate reductase